jgi:hypothetical protein
VGVLTVVDLWPRGPSPWLRRHGSRYQSVEGRTSRDIDEDGSLTHDGSAALRVHVHNARRRTNQWGISLGNQTRGSKKLVDLAVCMVGARLGRKIA